MTVKSTSVGAPLAARMRPRSLDQVVGQQHLIGEGKPLRLAIETNAPHSLVFWGPPGVGKTTLARLIAAAVDYEFIALSAIMAGVKDVRAAVSQAEQARAEHGRGTLLFIDEIHRFSKNQQDAFLPFVEDGTFVLVGATTENPSFELNNALLSRVRVYLLRPLDTTALQALLQHAVGVLNQENPALAPLTIEPTALELLATAADGDARRALNLLEIAADLATDRVINQAVLDDVLAGQPRRFDNRGDMFYDQISALHKSLRGSDPDAALYWFCRMLDGGCDPLYIARRLVRVASEDIGNADPRALALALNGWDVYQRLGSPEGELALAQAVVYLAVAAKSNAVYSAYKAARRAAAESGSLEVPLHLRNAPTALLKDLGHGRDYRYAHDEDQGFAAGENYFPEPLRDSRYYDPVERGLELKIKRKLDALRALNK